MTFLKRKGGLFKKAHELSVLCSVDVAVVIFGHNKKLYEYSSSDINEIVGRFQYVRHCFWRLRELDYALTGHSMAALTSTKDRPTLLTSEAATTMMRMRKTAARETNEARQHHPSIP